MPRKQARYGQVGIYNSTLPDYTDGDDSGLQVDSKGRLIVSNLTADGAASPSGGMTVSGEYNLVQPTLTDGSAVTLQVDSNGNLRVVTSGASGYAEGATTAPATGTAILGRYKATAPSLTDGQMYGVQLDAQGNQKMTAAHRLDPINDGVLDYPFGHSYTALSAVGTTTLKTGAGVLHSIIITNAGAGTPAITVYDNTAASGTVIASFSVPTIGSYTLDVAFTTGLTINQAAATTSPTSTVSWR